MGDSSIYLPPPIMHISLQTCHRIGAWLVVSAICAVSLQGLAGCGGGGGGGQTSQPDTSAPTIAVVTTLGTADVQIAAAVSDNVAVTQVDFLIDGGVVKATQVDSQGRTRYVLSIPRNQLRVGRHSVVAQARDAANNMTESAAASFDVYPGSALVSPIKITASAEKAGGEVTFTIDIVSEKTITLTNFFIDGEFAGGRGDDQRHYSFTRVFSPGTHRLLVDVTDTDNYSEHVEVVVEI